MDWIKTDASEILMVLVSAAVTYAAILLLTKVVGLRSLSKMSAADFAMTVAVGSLFASTVSSASPPLLTGLTALSALFGGQWLVAWARRRSETVQSMVDNRPLLLMAGSEIIDEHLESANLTRADLFGKLREANALNRDEVLAVVFEPTGDVSVLHSSDPDARLDLAFLEGVVGVDRLQESAS